LARRKGRGRAAGPGEMLRWSGGLARLVLA
jgi:hypothetical protein